VPSWTQYQTTIPTLQELERCKNSWGLTFILKHGLFALDFDKPSAYDLFKKRIPGGACITNSPRGYHAIFRSNSITETIKGGNEHWIECLERIDQSLIEVSVEGRKKAKIDILGDGNLLHSPDSPGYTWRELYPEPATVNFSHILYDTFGYIHKFSDFKQPSSHGTGQWIPLFCPFCEFDGKRHKSESCSVDLEGGGYICHSCDRQGKLTEFIEQARKVTYPLPQSILDWEIEFKKRQSTLQANNEYGPPQSLKQFLSGIEIKPPLITGLANRGELIMVFGITGIGKSSFLEYIIACACTGVNIADIFLVMHPLKCLFIDAQMAPAEVGIRFETLFNKLRGQENFSIKSFSDFDIAKPEAQSWLFNTVKDGKYDIVVFDPLEDIHHLKENDNDDMSRVVAPMRTVANELNCAVFIGHHAGGDQYDRGKLLPKKPRGATAITDRMDTIFELISTNITEEKIFHVRKMRKALVARQNDIILKYNPDTLLMSLGGPAAIVKAYQQGAKDRYEVLSLLLQIKAFGLTDEAIGKRLNVVRSTITRYGCGSRKPDAEMQGKMMDLLKELEEENGANDVPGCASQA
jgi:hypothetical protein